jgi:hypothetical protein
MLASTVACEYGINDSTVHYIGETESDSEFYRFRVSYNIITVI